MLLRSFFLFFFLGSCQHFIKTDLQINPGDFPLINPNLPAKATKNLQNFYGEIPLDDHPDVEKWLAYFTGRGRDHMQTYLERSSRYLPLMKGVLKEQDLPENLVYVALIESGFSHKALSRANAVGYWQFILGTGKRYGLRVNGFVDERRDPVLSTQAAAEYFKDLYSLFGSWHLALAAYNSGEFRVNRAVLKYYNRDFWHLSSKKALPRETRNYIPKLIAAIHISKDPKKYGFYDLKPEAPFRYDSLQIDQSISLKKLSQHLNLSWEEIKKLNPMYKGEYVPIYESSVKIRVPVGQLEPAKLAVQQSLMQEPKYVYHYHYWYRVRSGDSLYKIARRHKTSISKLRRANRLGQSSLIRVGQRLKIPARRLVAKPLSSKKPLAKKSTNKSFHAVKKGQSLTQISKIYGLKLSQLKAWNNMKGNPVIHPGQKLRIKAKSNKKYHVVRKGDTLIDISKKYGIPLPKLMKENSLNFKSLLLTGTKLVIPQ